MAAVDKDRDKWIWMALQRLDTKLLLSKLIPPDWDWNQAHPVHGTPLMATVNEGMRLGTNGSEGAPLWKLLNCLLAQGADPRKVAIKASGQICSCGGTGEFPQLDWVKSDGHSAISLVYAILNQLEKHDKHYGLQIKNGEKMLEAFSKYEPECHDKKVCVSEDVVEMWEDILLQEQGSDVQLQVIGSTGQLAGNALRAHSVVLRRVSRVLGAALSTPMQEGNTGIIRVEGVSAEAVRLCLHLIYTGTTCSDSPKPALLLQALDLAHRWQVNHVVSMLERGLANLVSGATLAEIFEAAVLKDLHVLRNVCKAFAAKDVKHQAVLAQKLVDLQLSRRSAAEVSSATPDEKRRRRAF